MRSKVCLPVFLAMIMLVFIACGDFVEVKESSGNAQLVFEGMTDLAVEGQDITINRIRVWKSAPNNSAAGVVTSVDSYTFEIWATLLGETQSRYVVIHDLRADKDGNLYKTGFDPGRIFYDTAINVGDNVSRYIITAEDGLVANERAAYAVKNETTILAGITAVSAKVIDPASLAESPWSAIKYRDVNVGPLFSRGRSVKSDLTIKAKMGCAMQVADDAGNQAARTYLFGDVELGNQIHHTSGKLSTTATTENAGDDDFLRIDWTENWYLTGMNLNARHLRIFRARYAPFYTGRELPGVDKGGTGGKISGFETLVRACNTALKTAGTGGHFQMVSLNMNAAIDPAQPSYSEGGLNNYCNDLHAAVTGGEATSKSIDLTKPVNVLYPACALWNVKAQLGSWNGTSGSGPINLVDAGSGRVEVYHYHVEQTAIVTLTY